MAASPPCLALQEGCPGFHLSSGHFPFRNKGNHARATQWSNILDTEKFWVFCAETDFEQPFNSLASTFAATSQHL